MTCAVPLDGKKVRLPSEDAAEASYVVRVTTSAMNDEKVVIRPVAHSQPSLWLQVAR